jgi:hypothetical protein
MKKLAEGFLLDQVNVLNGLPITGWTHAPFPYQTNASHISITVPMPSENRFYRLRRP